MTNRLQDRQSTEGGALLENTRAERASFSDPGWRAATSFAHALLFFLDSVGPLFERSHALIDLAMTPAAPTLTTPATLFGHQEGMADGYVDCGTGEYDVYDLASDAWLRRTGRGSK